MCARLYAALLFTLGGCTPSPQPSAAPAQISRAASAQRDASTDGIATSLVADPARGDAAPYGVPIGEATGWQREPYEGPDLAKLAMTTSGDLLAIADDGTVRRRAGAQWEIITASGEAAALPVRDLIGFSVRDLWAIAYAGPPNRRCGLDFRPGKSAILHDDGRGWRVAKKVDGSKLSGIWGTDSRNLWVSASMDPSWDQRRRQGEAVLHFDGVGWRTVTVPGLQQADGVARAAGVWGTGRDDVWIFGGVDASYRFDGRTFGPIDVGTALPPAWGSHDDVWFVGGGRLMRWNAGVIRVVSLPCDTGNCWRSIAAASTKDIWVTGGDGQHGLVGHGDGEHWTVERMTRAIAMDRNPPESKDPTVTSIVFDGARFLAVTPLGLASHARAAP
jgi:hypothetical protein